MNTFLEIRVVTALTIVILIVGTIFYHYSEGWTWIESIYFCVVSLATVGYGDLHPTNDVSRIFTIFYILAGVGILVSFFSAQSSRFIERRMHHREENLRRRNKTDRVAE